MASKPRSAAETVSKAQAAAVDAFNDARKVAGALRSVGRDVAAEQLMARVAAAVRRELAVLDGAPAPVHEPARERAGGEREGVPAGAGTRARNSWLRRPST